ncbi:hypothetical protein D3C73_1344600 [compost metagenome]
MVQKALAIAQGLQVDVLAEARTQNGLAGRRRQVVPIAGAGMVAVGVGNHRALDRSPRIYIEVAGGTVQAFGTRDNKVHGVARMGGLVSYEVGAGREVLFVFRDQQRPPVGAS